MSVSIEDFKGVLELLEHERPDVRKQVLQVLHTFLQDDKCVEYFIENCSKETKLLAEMVAPGEGPRSYLSSVLVVLINLCDKGACSRDMLEVRVIQRVMLLLEKGGLPSELQELCLILINNLTSVSVQAVESLLQLENKILQGFYLSQLVRRFVDEHIDVEDLIVKPSEQDGVSGGGRDRTKWIGSILGNCAQCDAGRKMLIEDEENIERYTKLVSSKDAQLRLSVCSLLKNLLHDPETHPALVEHGATAALLSRIVNQEESNPDILNVLCNSVYCMSLSPTGVAYLDGSGAKKELLILLPSLPENTPAYADIKKVTDSLDDVQDVICVEAEEPSPTEEPTRKSNGKPMKPIPTESGVEVLDDEEEEEDIAVPLAPLDDDTVLAEKAMEDIE